MIDVERDMFVDQDADGAGAAEEEELRSPLDVTANRELNLGFIDEITDLVISMTLAPAEFCRLVALVTLATAMLRNARLPLSFSPIYANLYAVIIAMSSFYNKSTAINMARVFLKRAQLPHLIFPSQMSPEGLVEHMSKQAHGLILNDEIGRILGSHNVKYQSTLKSDLTDYYDCKDIDRVLRSGTISVKEPYLNILGATTPEDFYDNVTQKDWRSGFLARFLYVQPPAGKPNFSLSAGIYTDDYDQQIGILARRLQVVATYSKTDFIFQGGAFALWDEWQRTGLEQAYDYGDSVVAPLVKRYNIYALKFAMLIATARGQWGYITPDIMQDGINLSNIFKAGAHSLVVEKSNFGISGGKLERVLRVLQRETEKLPPKKEGEAPAGVTLKRLYSMTNMKRDELMPCIEKLVEISCATSIRTPKGNVTYIANGKPLPVKSWR